MHNITINSWSERDTTLYRKFELKDFSEALSFIVRLAMIAEKMDHHPRWQNTYNVVEIWLTTHDADNTVTAKDRQLAKAIDALFEKE